MWKDLRIYLQCTYNAVPTWTYETLAILFCLGTVALLAFMGLRKGSKYSVGLLLVEYIVLLLASTVLIREQQKAGNYDFTPFWSYRAIIAGREELIVENIMNVAFFIPIGIFTGCAFRRIKWWQVLLIGGSVSVVIETLQFFLHKGFTELDDLMHNTVGCLIGYGFFKLFQIFSWLKFHGRKCVKRCAHVL